MSTDPYADIRAALPEITRHGLHMGGGCPVFLGNLCIMQAVSWAAGERRVTDEPACVHDLDIELLITLNDAHWGTPEARAKALTPLAIKAVGTVDRDRATFASNLAALLTERFEVPDCFLSTFTRDLSGAMDYLCDFYDSEAVAEAVLRAYEMEEV